MQGEERLIMGGNTSTALGTTPNVTLSTATTGGTIAASTTVSVIAVALTMDGLLRCDSKNGPQWTVTRQNADGSNETYGGGAAAPGSSVTIATGGGTATNTVTASIANPPAGASAMAWYAGPVGQERLVGSAHAHVEESPSRRSRPTRRPCCPRAPSATTPARTRSTSTAC